MPDVLPNSSQEFWRPPALAHSSVSVAANSVCDLATICGLCGTEFMASSAFCYVCGAGRGAQTSEKLANWKTSLHFLRCLGLQNIKQALGLSVPALIGFVAGAACILAAVTVGSVVSVQNIAEYQGLQMLRVEWLLGSIASFAAGILLKDAGRE